MRIGMAADHGGFALKEELAAQLRSAGHEVVDFGANRLDPEDDYPDFVIPLAQAVASGKVDRGVAVCGSGVGAAVCANRIPGSFWTTTTHSGASPPINELPILKIRVLRRLLWVKFKLSTVEEYSDAVIAERAEAAGA
jgi:hypothetical protein